MTKKAVDTLIDQFRRQIDECPKTSTIRLDPSMTRSAVAALIEGNLMVRWLMLDVVRLLVWQRRVAAVC